MLNKKTVSVDRSSAAETQVLENRRSIDYDTLEFPVEVIVSKFNSEEPTEAEWYVPEYQRGFIWSSKFQSVFIESVLLNIPIPYMFVADTEDGRLEIVDGSQRIRTLDVFLRDELQLQGLLKLTKLNGFRFSGMTLAEQRRFKNRSLKIIKLSEKATPEIRAELFHRVNRSAELMESEIRRGSYLGPFYSFVQECSRSKEFLAVCPFSAQRVKRHEPEEYVTRYLVYKDHYKEFKHDVRAFLDTFVIDYNESFTAQQKKTHLQEFKKMVEFAGQYLPYGFARKRRSKD